MKAIWSNQHLHAIPDERVEQWVRNRIEYKVTKVYVATECQLAALRLARAKGEIASLVLEVNGTEYPVDEFGSLPFWPRDSLNVYERLLMALLDIRFEFNAQKGG